MKVKKDISIELRYLYTVEVEVDEDYGFIDYDDAKEKAFAEACVEHSKVSKHEVKTQRNLSDTWQAYDENGEHI